MTVETEIKKFPTEAPYSRDKLKFAYNYIEEIEKWRVDTTERWQKQIEDAEGKKEKLAVEQMSIFQHGPLPNPRINELESQIKYLEGFIQAKTEDLEALK